MDRSLQGTGCYRLEVAGLVFMGLQALFTGAAKAGEFPAIWGVLCPMLLLGFGLANLHRLRT